MLKLRQLTSVQSGAVVHDEDDDDNYVVRRRLFNVADLLCAEQVRTSTVYAMAVEIADNFMLCDLPRMFFPFHAAYFFRWMGSCSDFTSYRNTYFWFSCSV